MRRTTSLAREVWAVLLTATMTGFGATPAVAQSPGSVLYTPVTPMELPIEVEIELSPAGSLKQAALWKELYQLLKNPYAVDCPADDPATPHTNESYYCTATIERRAGFRCGDARPQDLLAGLQLPHRRSRCACAPPTGK